VRTLLDKPSATCDETSPEDAALTCWLAGVERDVAGVARADDSSTPSFDPLKDDMASWPRKI
jgi:hypothetical protein